MPSRSRTPLFLLIAVMLVALAVAPAAATAADAPAAAVAKAHAKGKHKHPKRLGGKVRRAWPAPGTRRPDRPITRWLAQQVGPQTPVACSQRPRRARARCAARHAGAAKGAAVASAAGEPVAIAAADGETVKPLQLIRSFDIPADDPLYDQLLNWSWTYDSAVAATAFAAVDLKDQAGRLLDQLAALQRKDGSIEFAFDVLTGESSDQTRSGAIAWAGIGFTDYDAHFGDQRYLANARLAADYLLSLRDGDGLVRGGPEVKWVSTQHNLLTVIFLTNLAERVEQAGDPSAAEAYKAAAAEISKAIDAHLLVMPVQAKKSDDDKDASSLRHFRQGVGDDVIPLDTQAIGVVYAIFRGDDQLAKELYAYAQSGFALKNRKIATSKKTESYNMTYAAKGPFTGFRPYLGKGAPDVLWFEGTAEMRLVGSFLGESTEALDTSMSSWWDVTRKQGLAPLGADKTVTDNAYNQYHVWPTAAAGAWAVLSGASKETSWAIPPAE